MSFTFFHNISISEVSSSRTVYVGQKYPPYDLVVEHFPSNKVITSKYTAFNFIFKNMFEQFRRVANFYFLCIAIVQFCIRSPVSPVTSLTPLIFVVSITAIKQAYEDWLRHKSDNLSNNAPAIVYRKGKFETIASEDIKVGDVVKVNNDEEAPCDLVLLSCSNKNGKCQITTANLDGEPNLKIHECSKLTSSYSINVLLSEIYTVIECDCPTPELYKFNGNITLINQTREEQIASLCTTNLLLKGATLKNTDFVYGCAIYTGKDTKMVLNLKLTPNKFSTVEKTLNTFLLSFTVLLLIECTVGISLLLYYDASPLIGKAWYIPVDQRSKAYSFVEDFLSFVVMFNYIIPISLYVTLEMIKFIGAKFFVWDLLLYDETLDEPAICNSSDLNEELGQIEHLFTDKTGTLTENEMLFRKCSINGTVYVEHNGHLCLSEDESFPVKPRLLEDFLIVLALCNTVQIQPSSNQVGGVSSPVEYFASSLDEKALVEACARFGVTLTDINGDEYKIETSHGIKVYKKLCTLEFTPERKRMSTIIQDEEGNITLYCKGADSAVLNRVCSGEIDLINKQVQKFSQTGLRTLVIAEKSLTLQEYNVIENALQVAQCRIDDREDKLFNYTENDLTLLGATAIEDRLQNNVAHTLEALRLAGIKVWVLTGDHQETALSVSYACGHIGKQMAKVTVVKQQSHTDCYIALKEALAKISEEPLQNYALIIDGQSFTLALDTDVETLRKLSEHCSAVLCCRMSPLQKSQVVKMIKNSTDSPVTAAIGDGANDVSMIQEAHVGIGIIGKEGRQAVRCSDFAFTKFRFLERTLLIHGQYYYMRAAVLVQYFFYKNFVFVIPEFLYIFYNGFTPQPVYNGVFLMLYNIFFTSLPIFIFGCTEKHYTEEYLYQNPCLYRTISKNRWLSFAQFAKWIFQGFWHCFVIFFGFYYLWNENPIFCKEGFTAGMWSFGTMVFHVVVITANLKLALHTKFWTKYYIISLVATILGFIGFTLIFTQVFWGPKSDVLYGVYLMMLRSAQVWSLTFLLIILALLPDVIWILYERHNSALRKVTSNVISHLQRPRSYLRFTSANSNEQPSIALSQINAFSHLSETSA